METPDEKPSRARALALLVATSALLGLGAVALREESRASEAEPFVPRDDSEVLERLPLRPGDPGARELRTLRQQLAEHPRDLALALRVARAHIAQARARSDPRFLGHAQAALAPWWTQDDPPPAVLTLRAIIRQSSHDFEGALEDLGRVLQVTPTDAQAWLTRSVILLVRGETSEARRSCEALQPLVSKLVSAVCFASVDSLSGRARAAYTQLADALARTQSPGPEVTAWAVSTLAEIAVRAGDAKAAERHFIEALALDAGDGYTRGAYADLLLDTGRPAEAVRWLKGQEHNDALLLRLAIAERQLGTPEAHEHEEALRARFAASHLRGDTVHRREEARFELVLRQDARKALELARANWEVQREPWDARLLLEAALAAHAPDSARPALEALEASGYEEPTVRELVRQLRGGRP